MRLLGYVAWIGFGIYHLAWGVYRGCGGLDAGVVGGATGVRGVRLDAQHNGKG